MFRVKICGITRVEDALLAVDAGADAVGLNFFPQSPRCVSNDAAREIVAAVGNRACKVGVFVNARREDVLQAHEELGLDLVQLHGDESPAFLHALGAAVPVMRAFRCTAVGLAPIGRYLDACRVLGCPPRMVLIDAYQAGVYGGTGHLPPWEVVARFRELRFPYPLALAGGLAPENVGEAILAVRPAAVDVASGVEERAGIKDPARTRAFVAQAQAAFSVALAR